jgi:hypothetical protein
MAVTKGSIPGRLAETLISDTVADSTSESDVFSGITLATKIYIFRLDNSAIKVPSYFKGQIAAAYNDSNPPDITLYAPAGTITEYVFDEGWPANSFSGSDKFSFIGTSTAASTGTQSDPISSTDTKFKVTLLGGT